MSMKFSEYVLSEGRKENLLSKYSDGFTFEQLDYLLNDDFIKSTNYKYADFILDRLQKFYNLTPGTRHIQDGIDAVKQFDRLKSNLEKKDINQYQSLGELYLELKNYTSKSQERKIDSEAKKIYEDGRILIVKPLSHKASCKYGAGTKWCTTQDSPGYYDKYTTGSQGLYYIIMKDFDKNNKFYKIALHKGNYNVDTWYDAEDTVLPPREVEILKVGMGKKAAQSIEIDFQENKNKVLKSFFNPENSHHVVVEKNLYGSKKPLVFEFKHPILIDNELAEIQLGIFFGDDEDEEKIEEGNLKIQYNVDNDNFNSDIGYEPSDDFEPPIELDGLWRMDITLDNFPMSVVGDIGPFKRYCNLLSSQIWRRIQNDEKLQKLVVGDKKIWNPDRHSYGFTFQRKGLINKLVDYLDSSKEGNAIDFLLDTGVIQKGTYPSGETYYLGKKGTIQPKGYFSSFFASAVRAGILSYTRKNKKNILTKGPNFDDFKQGNLAAI